MKSTGSDPSNHTMEIQLSRSDLHWKRKVWHMGVGSIGLGIYYSAGWSAQVWGAGLVLFSILALGLDLIRLKNRRLNQWIIKHMGLFMRRSEKNSLSGLPFYALGVGVASLLFPEPWCMIGVFLLVYCDPIASAVGVKFGRTQIIPHRTVKGCMAFFVTAMLIGLVWEYPAEYHDYRWAFAIYIGSAGVLSDLLSEYFSIDDNFGIPVISGALISLIPLFFFGAFF